MKFGNLLKKELRELITPQALVSMGAMLLLFIFLGQMLGSFTESMEDVSSATVYIEEKTAFVDDILASLKEESIEVTQVELASDDYAAELDRLELDNVIIIPTGFTDSILVNKEPAPLKIVSKVAGGGMVSTAKTVSATEVIEAIERVAEDSILLESYGITPEEVERIKAPVNTTEISVLNGRSAEVATDELSAVLMMQSMIVPIALFFMVMMASQMIMTAISTEKIDKTLETLLSTPVSRLSILGAKMLAAVISALLNAVVMMIGMVFYIGGMLGSAGEEMMNMAVAGQEVAADADGVMNAIQAMGELGMSISVGSYVLFGIQIFVSVMIALAVSLLLGAMATDIKSVQTLTMPIMLFTMIPFFVTMFADVNTMSTVPKLIMYAIPFTHAYTAMNNLVFGHTALFWGGLAYQLVFFAVCMFLAVRLFTTDKIFTMSYQTGAGKGKKGLIKQ